VAAGEAEVAAGAAPDGAAGRSLLPAVPPLDLPLPDLAGLRL
jgi:hypothetical protein